MAKDAHLLTGCDIMDHFTGKVVGGGGGGGKEDEGEEKKNYIEDLL